MKQKHTKYTQINRNKSTHSEIGPVWQNANHRWLRFRFNDQTIVCLTNLCRNVNINNINTNISG